MTFISVEAVTQACAWLANWLPAADAALVRRATVLVSGARAHALRRALAVGGGQTGRLLGVRFLDTAAFAREVLARRGEARTLGWEEVRRLRIHHCLESAALRGRLRYFDADQLRAGRGYADAFARVIADLEESGLDISRTTDAARDLVRVDALAAKRLHDVATVWAAADRDQGVLRSVAQLLTEAASAVRRTPALGAEFGPVAAFVTASPSPVLLQFLSALPECAVVFLDARPLRAGTQRWREFVQSHPGQPGIEADSHGGGARPAVPLPAPTELALVQRFLFAPAEVVADPARPRSAGPDGSVDVEEYPSVEDEIDAAAVWVGEQIAAGVPLEAVALVVPALDPHASLLCDRLARSTGGDSVDVPIYVAGGLPLADAPAGVRVGRLLRALVRGLEAEATIALLPSLRRAPEDERRPLSPSRAAEIVYGAGIVGGSPGDPAGALEWLPRLRQRRDLLGQLAAEPLERDAGEPDKRRHLHSRREADDWIADVEPLLPAIEALQTLAATIIDGAPLRIAWQAIREFAATHLHVIPEPVNWLALIEEHLDPVLSDQVADAVTGVAAVAYVLDRLGRARMPHGRFGEPRVFVGTADSAAGLPFRALRVLGLAEGIVPRTPHDDPIVPNDARVRVEEVVRPRHPHIVIARLEDRVLEDLHALFRVVGGVQERLALSASRQWIDRSDREVSGVMLEVAAALGRQSLPAARGQGDVPTAARLRAAYYGPGRAARREQAAGSLQPRAVFAHLPWHDGGWRVPAGWCRDAAVRLDRVQEILAAGLAPTLAASDGVVAAPWPAVRAPGLTPERAISASALTTLLVCPHRFLLQTVLNLAEPSRRPSTDTIDARAYGSLFHRVAEAFFGEHGPAFCAREGTLEDWRARARAIAGPQFDQWRGEYPLRGEDAIARERERLCRQIAQLVDAEWRLPQRTFLSAERRFGDPNPVRLEVAGGALYVSGQIDRVDRLGAAALSVRDLKTGRVRDFSEEPLHQDLDLQIGLYTLVMEAEVPGATVTHAAYVHPSAAQEPERGFAQADLDALRERTRVWLAVARGLLASGVFPRTPRATDCEYCPFRSACGDGAQARSARKLADAVAPAVAAFVQLKQQGPDDEGS